MPDGPCNRPLSGFLPCQDFKKFPSLSNIETEFKNSSDTNTRCSRSNAMADGQMNSPAPSPYFPNSVRNSSSPWPFPRSNTPTRVPLPVLFQGTEAIFSPPRFKT